MIPMTTKNKHTSTHNKKENKCTSTQKKKTNLQTAINKHTKKKNTNKQNK